MLLKILSE